MPLIPASEVEAVLRERLAAEGYALSVERRHGQTGTDIIASRADEAIHIEAISFKRSPPARSKDFYEVFFRATSRLSKGATLCVVALPERFGIGLRQRSAASGEAWQRMGKAFPELEIWLVNVTDRTYHRTTWSSWAG